MEKGCKLTKQGHFIIPKSWLFSFKLSLSNTAFSDRTRRILWQKSSSTKYLSSFTDKWLKQCIYREPLVPLLIRISVHIWLKTCSICSLTCSVKAGTSSSVRPVVGILGMQVIISLPANKACDLPSSSNSQTAEWGRKGIRRRGGWGWGTWGVGGGWVR